MHRDLVVTARDGIDLAVRDHGGDGPPLLLMHGAGSHLMSVGRLVRAVDDHRVVTMDQRHSGQSGDSHPYSWDALVDDVECVVDELDLEDVVVAGHSWGGMIAARYGVRHPEARAVVNIDGHGPGDASLYAGIEQAEVDALSARVALPPPWLGAEGDDSWKAEQLARVRSENAAAGVPAALADEFAARSFAALPDSRWQLRPTRTMYEGLTGDLQLFDVYRHVDAPLLVIVTGGSDWGPPGAERLMAAYRRGVLRALRELAEEHPNVVTADLPEATHMSVVGRHAPDVAAAISAFLATLPTSP